MATQRPDLRECICGRLLSKPHCPMCGSSQVLASARKRDYVTRADGSTAELKVYRCRICGSSFNDDQRTLCVAPPPRISQKMTPTVNAPPVFKVNPRVPDLTLSLSALEERAEKLKRSRGITEEDYQRTKKEQK